jgi:hypothetical protein
MMSRSPVQRARSRWRSACVLTLNEKRAAVGYAPLEEAEAMNTDYWVVGPHSLRSILMLIRNRLEERAP